jgi:arylsulfatase A
MEFMERNQDRPFFLYYPMILVHSPFVPTPDSEEWQDKDMRLKKDVRFFKDMVEYTDKIVRKLVAKIEELGLENNTIFIFTADNGTHYSLTTQTVNGPFRGGKGTMPDAGTHVPMVVYNPSMITEPFEYNGLFEFSDFLPSFLEMAGIPVPGEIDGKSFYPLFSGREQNQRETVFVHYDPLKSGGSERWYGRFVRNKDYKLYNDGRYYKISNDPGEKNPLPPDSLSPEELLLKNSFQEKLDAAPEHYFKQPHEYKKK